jgi:FtsP/CotA-like multicopper oxidase with cupredoxin domain
VQSARGRTRAGARVERGWKGSVRLEDRETVEVLIRFEAESNRGSKDLMHCRELEHENMDMLSAFKVV